MVDAKLVPGLYCRISRIINKLVKTVKNSQLCGHGEKQITASVHLVVLTVLSINLVKC